MNKDTKPNKNFIKTRVHIESDEEYGRRVTKILEGLDFDHEDEQHPNLSSPNPKHTPFNITNEIGRIFHIRFLSYGTNYGRNNVLTHGKDKEWSVEAQGHVAPTKYEGDTIEFYDTHNSDDKSDWQFVSRYHIETILYDWLTKEPNEWNSGLNLHGGVDEWSIDSNSMKQIARHLKNNEKGFDFGT